MAILSKRNVSYQKELLRYMSEGGVTVPDIFRRPGNTAEQKKLIKKLTEGKHVNFSDYNFYTLASVIKVSLINMLLLYAKREMAIARKAECQR